MTSSGGIVSSFRTYLGLNANTQQPAADSSRIPSLVDRIRSYQSTTSSSTDAPQSLPSQRPKAQLYDFARRNEQNQFVHLGTVDELASSSSAEAVAARNVQRGLDYYGSRFGRNGLDDAGKGVSVIVNDRSADASGKEYFRGNGGYYTMPDGRGGSYDAIHYGTGIQYDASHGRVDQREMLYSDDLAVHELTHGVIREETGRIGGDADQSGATNEALADIMAASATRDWRIGEGMYSPSSDIKLMRNISQPDDPTAVHGLWTHMNEVSQREARGEPVQEHWASGVLSTAAYRMQQRIGGEAGWRAVEQVFYDVIDRNMLGDMKFATIAQSVRSAAAQRFGAASPTFAVINEELQRAGL